jgi:hypothetical protein
VRNATEFGFRCAQSFNIPGYSPPFSEDCLFLNVYTPVEALCKGHAAKLPVMVWFHGGGYVVDPPLNQVAHASQCWLGSVRMKHMLPESATNVVTTSRASCIALALL